MHPMAGNGGSVAGNGGNGGSGNRIIDMKEVKSQLWLSLPMIATSVASYSITLISVMFAGHLGQLELTSSTLANSWATVTGFGLMSGLSGALETLCGQAFGAKQYQKLGIHLQFLLIISFFCAVIVSVIWFFGEPILILLHQKPEVAKMTSVYLRYLIPGLFAQSILQCILKFLQAQSSVIPLIICSFVPLGLHVGITYGLVYHTVLGFKGTALAPSISWWISVIMLGGYVKYSEKLKHTWQGFSIECFRHVLPNLKLAIPSAGMVCLENLAFEILVLMAGSMPDSEISTSLIAICVNTESIAFMAIYGFSAAVSTHVSNELGAGRVDQAKNAMAVTLKLSVLLVVVMILLILFGHHIWASAFTKSHVIKKAFASMAPFLAASVALDSTQGILSGVARGGGWQRWAVWINLGSFCIVGTPIALLLAFKGHLYAKGLWIGLICGLFCQACALLVLTLCASWKKMESSVPSDREDVDNMSSANDATNIELV